MAFSKKVFNEVNGFKGNLEIASGDDVFLMMKIKKLYPGSIGFLKSQDAIVYTRPVPNLTLFIRQRIRWASKTLQYSDTDVSMVSLITYFANLSFLVSVFLLFFSDTFVYWSIGIIGMKLLADFVFLFFVTSFFGRRNLLIYFPLEEAFYALYVVLIGAFSQFAGTKWKDRIVN